MVKHLFTLTFSTEIIINAALKKIENFWMIQKMSQSKISDFSSQSSKLVIKFVLFQNLFRKKVCFIKKYVSSKCLFCWKVCCNKKVVLMKSLFHCQKDCFVEKFVSLKSLLHWKVSFVKKFVLSKILFLRKNFLWSIFVKWSLVMSFLAGTNANFHPEIKYVGISKIRQESSGLWPFFYV